jgi:hypothetical protein
MESTRETREGDVQPVVASPSEQNDASFSTSAPAQPADSLNAPALPQRDEAMTLLGPALLLTDEDPDSWEKLRAAVFAALVPADIFENFWARDIVDHEWNILRLRRLSAGLISATQQQALESVLRPLMSNGMRDFADSRPELLAWKYVLHHDDAINEVNGLLETAGLRWDAVQAKTMSFNAEIFERLDRMCITAEARRDAALREIDRHRLGFGQRLRRAINHVEDAEFRVIEPPGKQEAA